MFGRFYFDVDNGRETVRDDEGVVADDLEQALADARSVISEMADELGATSLESLWTLVVRDETGLPVAHLPLGLFSSSQQEPP